jgi:hypothetical protein
VSLLIAKTQPKALTILKKTLLPPSKVFGHTSASDPPFLANFTVFSEHLYGVLPLNWTELIAA